MFNNVIQTSLKSRKAQWQPEIDERYRASGLSGTSVVIFGMGSLFRRRGRLRLMLTRPHYVVDRGHSNFTPERNKGTSVGSMSAFYRAS